MLCFVKINPPRNNIKGAFMELIEHNYNYNFNYKLNYKK